MRWITTILVVLGCWALAQQSPAEAAEQLRAALSQAALELNFDSAAARSLLQEAEQAALQLEKLGLRFEQNTFAQLKEQIVQKNPAGFAQLQARLWTDLLAQSYRRLEEALRAGNLEEARNWASLREYRPATPYAPPAYDATLALEELAHNRLGVQEALTAVQSDLLGAYQARLTQAIEAAQQSQQQGYRVRLAEQIALAQGYFAILADAYRQQRGEAALAQAQQAFASEQPAAMLKALEGFQAAPLSPRERAKRANQTLRFLQLVPVEYRRGVRGAEGEVRITNELEIIEARSFLRSAQSAWKVLEPLLIKDQQAQVNLVNQRFAWLEQALYANTPPTADRLSDEVAATVRLLSEMLPESWRRADPSGDLEVIRQQLRSLENAVAAGRYDLAETARLDAYAMLESGAEARLRAFNPQLALDLESLFWNGVNPPGLARLIRDKASALEVRNTRRALENKLNEAARILGRETSPTTIGINAAIIVFREGLEAVLIIAALLASFRRPENLHLRRPVWWGVGLALVASLLTWAVMWGTIQQFARFGERVEAVVSLLAIAVLLLILNWFYHKVYWTDRLADFHQHKQQAVQKTGWAAILGLVAVGFESIYREGFETVLFLQSLVLQGGFRDVLWGILVGLSTVILLGIAIFRFQIKLPQKKMLIFTGVLILMVLVVMVGQTTHVMQVVGWLPIHAFPLEVPFWLSSWFGLYATWEGIVLQALSAGVVLGSYFWAERIKRNHLGRLKTA